MKKLVALLLTMMFVMGLAAYAAAEVAISGDARVRGVYSNNNTDYDDDSQDHKRFYDQRIRLNIDGKNDDDAQVKMQVTVAEGEWGNAAVSGDTVGLSRAENYAYVLVPFGDFKVEAGLMPADWGLKFMSWGTAKERVKVYTKMGDMTVGAFTQKDDEASAPATVGTEDKDTYAAYVVTPMGDLKAGAIVIYTKDDGKQDKDTGHAVDAFVTGKMGDMSLNAEVAYQGGDLNESSEEDSKMGAFASVGMPMGDMSLAVTAALTQNGYVANKYFTPTVLIGTSQPTAAFELGQCGAVKDDAGAAFAGWSCDTTALQAALSMKVADAMSVTVSGTYAMLDGYGVLTAAGTPAVDYPLGAKNELEITWTELDAKFKYTIGDNTYYEAAVGYATVDAEWAGEDLDADTVLAVVHGLYINF